MARVSDAGGPGSDRGPHDREPGTPGARALDLVSGAGLPGRVMVDASHGAVTGVSGVRISAGPEPFFLDRVPRHSGFRKS